MTVSLRSCRAAFAALAACAAMSFGPPAEAHAHLVVATPAADGVAPSPTQLTLQFSEPVDLQFTGVVVSDAARAVVRVGPARIDAANPSTLVVPLTAPLAPGRYAVEWHAVSADGHKTQGRYAFVVED